MQRRWFLAGIVLLLGPLLLAGCGVAQEEFDAVQEDERVALQSRLSEAQSNLTEVQGDLTTAKSDLTTAQGDLTTAQGDLTEAQSDLTEAENQIDTIETDLAALQGKYMQISGDPDRLASQLQSLEGQLESQLRDYDVLMQKMTEAKVYAEMLDKYILTPYFKLTAQEKIDLDHLVHFTGNEELIAKWAVFYFSGREADTVEFYIAVGDGLWQVLR